MSGACALALLLAAAGCADYGPHDRMAMAGGYDGYYDDFYGPYNDGYWGGDGYFYYSDHPGHFNRDEAHHFRRDAASGFHGVRAHPAPPAGHGESGREGRTP